MESQEVIMYQLKPVFELKEEITLPTNMYRMKNLHLDSSVDDKNDGLEIVQKRQELLLHKLTEIKKLLTALKDELGVTKIETGKKEATNMFRKPNFTEFGITHDVVLNVSIAKRCPPFSLLVIDKIWPEISLKYTCHLHSSASSLSPAFKQFQKQLEGNNPESKPDLNIRVVWKIADVDCEFVISPITSVPIIGEVNFLRFLFASLNNNNSTDVVKQTLIDEKLDACHCLALCQSNEDMKPFLQILSNDLKFDQWLCGDNISIVDIAAWSVCKQIKRHNLGTVMLNDWFQKCTKYFGM